MMNIVIDSSVVIKWFFDEIHTAKALEILTSYNKSLIALFAPDLIYAEIGNIIWKKQALQKLETIDSGQIISYLHDLQINIVSNKYLLSSAYEIAVTHKRTVYDSLYLALSERE